MKLNQLQMVLAIASKGSLRAAARELGVPQPSLTRSIGELERELGGTLFERCARGMVPTPVGRIFLRRAAVIDSEARRAREEVSQFLGTDEGEVVICLSVVAHLALLPMALPLFRKRFPGVRLRIVEGAFPAVEPRLRDGGMDFYIGPAPEPTPTSEFLVEKLMDNTRAVFARRDHPLAQAQSLSELKDANWITTGITDKAEAELRELFATHGLPPPKAIVQAESMLTMLTILMSSDTLAITARQYEESPLTRNALQRVNVRERLEAPPIVLVRRVALPLAPAADYFSDMFRRATLAYRGRVAAPTHSDSERF
ncbi:LysR family transcriptional regulator [Ramlibacter sp. AW1]|uniref:LysR family transcriptional regulator n=1 Tax=Ramlibacter aurantiacus TaxID=2801330 RepID=A0A937D812_9BURK|nr:LysR substrate-binding domain-containing protein [Ramlibacter aurantiacus]MBL0421551.1 LysR family transcriptional regulator [Ramlibacter aurantiacus]